MSPGVQRFCACLALAGPANGQNSTPQGATQSPAGAPVRPAETEGQLAEEVRNPLADLTQVQFRQQVSLPRPERWDLPQ
ncbi:MAG: hypothetical protein WA847_16905, partial [Terriglobales bacterium]